MIRWHQVRGGLPTGAWRDEVVTTFELLSPLIFVLHGRRRYVAIGFCYLFHLVTFLTITISFAPHLVAMTSFLPLEKLTARQRAGRGATRHPVPVAGDPPVGGPG